MKITDEMRDQMLFRVSVLGELAADMCYKIVEQRKLGGR